jgi:alcohol dehydrogenase/propanol-preferring alcohol dehydrogenase
LEGYAIVKHQAPLEKLDLPTPVPTGSQVLIAVTHAGVCHSDLHIIDGVYDLGSRGTQTFAQRGGVLPLIPGHEIVGTVVSWGPDVEGRGLEVGATRLVFPWIGCGTCARCRADEQNLCLAMKPIGLASHGGYASHLLVPNAKYLLDIDGIDPALAATYACSGVTVYGAVRKLLPLDKDETVVVIGAGGLGLSAVSVLRAIKHERILVIDSNPAKLEAARRHGASETLLAEDESAAISAAIAKICGGVVHSILDTVNAAATALIAFDALTKGGRMIQVGLYGGELRVPLPILTARAATVRGTHVGGLAELRELLDLARSGALPDIPITRRPMHEANDALQALRDGKVVGRTVLVADPHGHTH